MKEEQLAGGITNAGQVARVGPHLLRPATPFSVSTQEFLGALAAAGFDGAPEPVGFEEDGRERLTFIEGDVPLSPYPQWSQTDDALASIARLLRRFHDAARFFDHREHSWNRALGDPHHRSANDLVMCHNDLELSNIVFRESEAVAFIDFEFASPGRPVWDLAQLARLCVPIEHEVDQARMGWIAENHPARLRLLADSYGLDGPGRLELFDAVVDSMAHIEAWVKQTSVPTDILGGIEKYDRRRTWWADRQTAFAIALR